MKKKGEGKEGEMKEIEEGKRGGGKTRRKKQNRRRRRSELKHSAKKNLHLTFISEVASLVFVAIFVRAPLCLAFIFFPFCAV